MLPTEQQNARSSDNIPGHGRGPVSEQPNRERPVLQIRLPMGINNQREVEEHQVQLLNVSVLELLTLQCQTTYLCAAHCDLTFVSSDGYGALGNR